MRRHENGNFHNCRKEKSFFFATVYNMCWSTLNPGQGQVPGFARKEALLCKRRRLEAWTCFFCSPGPCPLASAVGAGLRGALLGG